jgi:hypothetical protein
VDGLVAVAEPNPVSLFPGNLPRIVSTSYLIDTRTHTTSMIAVPSQIAAWGSGRSLAWKDSHTLLLFSGSNGSPGPTYSYDVLGKTLHVLPGVHAAEGVVHCSTLFYLELTSAKQPSGQELALLHRYDLDTQREIGLPVRLGSIYASWVDFPIEPSTPPWDVSSDGTHLVYQRIDGQANPFIVADADGSHARPLFSASVRADAQFAALLLSRDGQTVALIRAGTNGCVTSRLDGSQERTYGELPVDMYALAWLPDSSGFDAVTSVRTDMTWGDPFLGRFLLATPPGPDGLVRGITQFPEAQTVAILS